MLSRKGFAYFVGGLALAWSFVAGADLRACRTAHQTALEQCRGAGKKVSEQEAARSQLLQAGCSGKDAKQPGLKDNVALCSQQAANASGASASALGDMVKTCEGAEALCNKACSSNGAAPNEVDAIKQEKDACDKAVKGLKENAEASRATALSNQSGNSDSSGAASALSALAGMKPQSSDDKKKTDDAKKADTESSGTANKAASAASPASVSPPNDIPVAGFTPSVECSKDVTDESCATKLEQNCQLSANKNSSTCRDFRAHYCAPSAKSASAASSRPGAGLGSEFCQASLASQFCHDPKFPGRSQCPSCMKERGLSPTGASTDAATCGTDPLYAVPGAAAKALASSAGGAGGASGGSGGGSLGSSGATASAGSALPKGGDGDGHREGIKANVGSAAAGEGGGGGGGAGGGFGGGPGGVGFEAESLELENFAGQRALASAAGGGVTDVEYQPKANVIMILEQVMRSRCEKGLFLHCTRAPGDSK